MTLLKYLKYAVVIAIIISGIIFAAIHFWPIPRQVTLPGGQVINLDTKSFNNSVQQILKKVDDQNKQVNNLESAVRQLQTHTVTQEIPAALKETSIARSVATMKGAW